MVRMEKQEKKRMNEDKKAIIIADLKNRFTYHPPKGDQQTKYVSIRQTAEALALLVFDFCPESRERSLAWTKLEEAVMWANASIARNE
jgi:hypothetical protein